MARRPVGSAAGSSKLPVVCVDCSPLLVRSAGVKTYLFHLVNALRELAPANVKSFLAPPGQGKPIEHDGGPQMYPRQIGALTALNKLPRFFCDIAAPACDVFHCSNLLRKPPLRPRLTATLHDLTSWIVPECHIPENIAADRWFADQILSSAAGVIAVSENTKRDAIRILGLAPEKIRVIHLGVPDQYFSVAPEQIAQVALKHRLHKPYLLFVGTVEPRKNLDTLISAWDQMPAGSVAENELVVAGMAGWQADATMARLLQAKPDRPAIRYLGYVPEDDLPGLTAGALGFVYPSLYEGFGIPVAQAMAAGCPVITSNVSSLPEITAGAALLVDPRSPCELSGAMLKVIDSAALRQDLRDRASQVASRYTWQRAAREAMDFFAEVSA